MRRHQMVLRGAHPGVGSARGIRSAFSGLTAVGSPQTPMILSDEARPEAEHKNNAQKQESPHEAGFLLNLVATQGLEPRTPAL